MRVSFSFDFCFLFVLTTPFLFLLVLFFHFFPFLFFLFYLTLFHTHSLSLSASRLGRPVRINLDRDQDMWSTGTRHPFKGIYRACAKKSTGKILGVDLELFSNAGFSSDLSESVMDRALFHCENSYKVPNLRVRGNLALTNTVTNTAFRGFGGPQGMLVCETYVEHLAKALNMNVADVRRANMYKEGECTHYGQVREYIIHCAYNTSLACFFFV